MSFGVAGVYALLKSCTNPEKKFVSDALSRCLVSDLQEAICPKCNPSIKDTSLCEGPVKCNMAVCNPIAIRQPVNNVTNEEISITQRQDAHWVQKFVLNWRKEYHPVFMCKRSKLYTGKLRALSHPKLQFLSHFSIGYYQFFMTTRYQNIGLRI